MSRTPPSSQIAKVEHDFWLRQRIFNGFQQINGGIDLGESTQTSLDPANPNTYTGNVAGIWANVTAPGVANTEFAVSHNLGRIPTFYWIIADRACSVYQLPNTGTAWTSTQVFLKCSVANAVLRIFVL